MSERTYSQVNTGISVREASFLSPAQFDALQRQKRVPVSCKGRPMPWRQINCVKSK